MLYPPCVCTTTRHHKAIQYDPMRMTQILPYAAFCWLCSATRECEQERVPHRSKVYIQSTIYLHHLYISIYTQLVLYMCVSWSRNILDKARPRNFSILHQEKRLKWIVVISENILRLLNMSYVPFMYILRLEKFSSFKFCAASAIREGGRA